MSLFSQYAHHLWKLRDDLNMPNYSHSVGGLAREHFAIQGCINLHDEKQPPPAAATDTSKCCVSVYIETPDLQGCKLLLVFVGNCCTLERKPTEFRKIYYNVYTWTLDRKDKHWLFICLWHTHTHTHIYIYIYIHIFDRMLVTWYAY